MLTSQDAGRCTPSEGPRQVVQVDFSNIESVRRNWKYTGPRQDEWSSIIADFRIFGYRKHLKRSGDAGPIFPTQQR
jgi:hypothetical protein